VRRFVNGLSDLADRPEALKPAGLIVRPALEGGVLPNVRG